MTKEKIITNICYTELVYSRINKKLNSKLTKKEIQSYILEVIENTNSSFFRKEGKNYYISNIERNICVTVNSNTFRVITVNRITK